MDRRLRTALHRDAQQRPGLARMHERQIRHRAARGGELVKRHRANVRPTRRGGGGNDAEHVPVQAPSRPAWLNMLPTNGGREARVIGAGERKRTPHRNSTSRRSGEGLGEEAAQVGVHTLYSSLLPRLAWTLDLLHEYLAVFLRILPRLVAVARVSCYSMFV